MMNDEKKNQRILIADDEPFYLRTTGQLLRKAGYECECVPDGDSALEKLRSESFDLILSDLNMPGNLKLELLEQGRRQWPHIPLIVITGVPSLPTAIESVRLGVADYLLKPVKYEDLLASVTRVLSQSAPPAAEANAGASPFKTLFEPKLSLCKETWGLLTTARHEASARYGERGAGQRTQVQLRATKTDVSRAIFG